MQNPYPFVIQKLNSDDTIMNQEHTSDETIEFLIHVKVNEPEKGRCSAKIEYRDKQLKSCLGDGKNLCVEGSQKDVVMESIKRILEAYPKYKVASPMPD